jgi:hypothetical protein
LGTPSFSVSKFDAWIDEVALDDTRIGCTQ